MIALEVPCMAAVPHASVRFKVTHNRIEGTQQNRGHTEAPGRRTKGNLTRARGAKIREEKMSSWAIGSGAIMAAGLYLGLAILTPNTVPGAICALVGVASGVVFIGLMDRN
jgi:hypothetical protein